MEEETTHCIECEGTGIVEDYAKCSVNADDCCASCTVEKDCYECSGTGLVTIEY